MHALQEVKGTLRVFAVSLEPNSGGRCGNKSLGLQQPHHRFCLVAFFLSFFQLVFFLTGRRARLEQSLAEGKEGKKGTKGRRGTMATTVLGKRQGEETGRPNKRARQREMKKVARRIPTQEQLQQLQQPQQPSSFNAGEEDKVIKLPNQIHIDKHVASYSYEIEALQNAIKTSSYGSSIRAWQMLPRHKRRRNASHNLLALPKRLRVKGRAELRASRTEPQSRSETRKTRGKGDRLALGAYPRRRESSRRRELIQRATKAALGGKAWMETHLWHAKRFRMSGVEGKIVGGQQTPSLNRWGFSLAEESSMKSYRSTWRDEKKGTSVMDVSYDAWFRIKSSVASKEQLSQAEEGLSQVLSKAGLADGWQEEWRVGTRCCKTLLTAPALGQSKEQVREKSAPLMIRCCAPVQVFWLRSDKSGVDISLRKYREVLLRVHPAAAATLLRFLHSAVASSSRGMSAKVEIQRLNSLPHPFVVAGSGAASRRHKSATDKNRHQMKAMNRYLEALRKKWNKSEAFNTFELGGPLAANLLAKVLRPLNAEEDSKMKAILKGSLDDGAIVPFDVHDPRLSFPPRNPIKQAEATEAGTLAWSSYSALFSQGCSPPTFRKGEIDRRRSKLTIPGSRLLPTSKDDIVPVVVVAHRQPGAGNSFTLCVPRAWGQAFWLSLVHPGTRVIGQVMSQAINFDKGKPSFPFDWAGTTGYDKQEESDSLIASDHWLRKPPAKRCNMDKMGVRWPFGGLGLWTDVVQNGQQVAMVPQDGQEQESPWMFASTAALSIDSLLLAYQSGSLSACTLQLIKSALVCVEVTACRKGSFAKWDEVHFLDKVQQGKWKSALLQVQQDSHSKTILQRLESQAGPSSPSHIGSVTTGNFALSRGKVSAFASVSLLAFLELSTMEENDGMAVKCRNPIPLDNLVLVKSVQGAVHRVANLRLASL